MSTLLNPAQRNAISLMPIEQRISITAAFTVSFTKTQTPSNPRANIAVSSLSLVSKYLNVTPLSLAKFSNAGIS